MNHSSFQQRGFNAHMIKKREEDKKIKDWAESLACEDMMKVLNKKRSDKPRPEDIPF